MFLAVAYSYVIFAYQIYQVYEQLTDGDFEMAGNLLFSIFVPLVICAVQLYGNNFLMRKPAQLSRKEALLELLNVRKGVEVYRAFKYKEEPNWHMWMESKVLTITLECLPFFTGFLKKALTDWEGVSGQLMLLALGQCISLLRAGWPTHVNRGSPSNLHNWRLIELTENRGWIPLVWLVDASQLLYRVGLFALVDNFAGRGHMVALVSSYWIYSFLLCVFTIEAMGLPRRLVFLYSWLYSIHWVIFDKFWFEMNTGACLIVRHTVSSRFIQGLIGLWLVAQNFEEKKESMNQDVLYGLIYFTTVMFWVWFVLYNYVVHFRFAELRKEKLILCLEMWARWRLSRMAERDANLAHLPVDPEGATCECGTKYLKDASYCHKCGIARPKNDDLKDAATAV